MAKYIHLFDTDEEFQAMYNDDEKYIEPWASYTRETESCDYNKPNPLATPFTIEMLEDGQISTYPPSISYSLNGGAWVDVGQGEALSISLSSGDTVSFKGNSGVMFSWAITGAYNVYGNFMSLVCGDDFATATTLPQDLHYFVEMLAHTSVVSAENLLLPATTLADRCYYQMFYDCTSLTTAPTILPATTLAENCYDGMFAGCTSLTTAPALPATTLAPYCYSYMFQGCTSLNSITCLATDISAEGCTEEWVSGVASTGTFTKAASMSSWTTGVNGIPNGWTVVPAQ